MRVVLSLVSALAVLFCGAPRSITALRWPPFGGATAYAGEADGPVTGGSAQPGSEGSGSASGNIAQPTKKVPGWMNPSLVFHHPIVIEWRGRQIKVPHDSDECAQALLYATIGKEVPIPDKKCRAVMAQMLEIYRTEPLPPKAPPKPHGDVPICEVTVAGHVLRAPHNGRECCLAVSEALHKNATVPAPNDECRAVMLQALEIQRNAPPEHANLGVLLPEALPPQPGTPGALDEPAAENAAPNAESAAPPRALVPHGGLLRIVPNAPPDGD